VAASAPMVFPCADAAPATAADSRRYYLTNWAAAKCRSQRRSPARAPSSQAATMMLRSRSGRSTGNAAALLFAEPSD